MPKDRIGDIDMWWERRGEGERLFFISGSGGDLRNTPNVFDGPLAKTFDTVAYDQRGLGRTSKPDEPYSMAQYADDAAARHPAGRGRVSGPGAVPKGPDDDQKFLDALDQAIRRNPPVSLLPRKSAGR